MIGFKQYKKYIPRSKSLFTFLLNRSIGYIIFALVVIFLYFSALSIGFDNFTDFDLDFFDWEDNVKYYDQLSDAYLKEKGITIELVDENFKVIERKGVIRKEQVERYSSADLNDILKYAYGYNIASGTVILNDRSYIGLVWQDNEKYAKNASNYLLYTRLVLGGTVFIAISMLILWMHSIYRRIKKDFNLIEETLVKTPYNRSRIKIENIPLKETRNVAESYNIMLDEMEVVRREKEKVEAKSKQLISDLSHDLKSPITALKGYSTMILDEDIPEEEKKDYMRYIHSSINDLNYMISMLFEQVKFQYSDYKLKKEPVDMNEFVRELCANYYMIYQQSGYDMDVQLSEEEQCISIDQHQMKRVITNILDNCLAHNPKGTTLFVEGVAKEHSYHLYLENDGEPIPESLREKIFDPFYQGDSSRTKNHGGLGLYITKQLIEKHGGYIKCYERQGRNVFEIILFIGK